LNTRERQQLRTEPAARGDFRMQLGAANPRGHGPSYSLLTFTAFGPLGPFSSS
jgi:hypothetical protein